MHRVPQHVVCDILIFVPQHVPDPRHLRPRNSGCRVFIAGGNRRLASEMISMPRSTSQRLRRSASKASSVTPAISLWMSSIASMMSVRRDTGERLVIQNTCNADASMRSRNTRCRLRRVMMSALRPRMREAASFTSISS